VPETIAVFGGSFNPPHIGHVLATTLVLATADVDRMLVIPTFKHPFAKSLAPFDDRVKMCELAMGWIPRVEISSIEKNLGGDSLTLRTLEQIQSERPNDRLRLVMGADILLEADKWFRFDEIKKLAPPLVLGRAGFDGPPPLLPELSSTDVRARIARGESLELVVPRAVLAYIRDKGLYGAR